MKKQSPVSVPHQCSAPPRDRLFRLATRIIVQLIARDCYKSAVILYPAVGNYLSSCDQDDKSTMRYLKVCYTLEDAFGWLGELATSQEAVLTGGGGRYIVAEEVLSVLAVSAT